MITLNDIRNDLKEIRYYYARKEIFDAAAENVGLCIVTEKARRYNTAIQYAPPKLFDLYVCLYVKYNTQEGLSAELGFTPEYVQKLHKMLLLFFQTQLSAQL